MSPLPVRVRPAVAATPPYVPGRRPSGDGPVARLASNELPDLLAGAGPHRYPEPTAADLRAALAVHLGVDADALVAGPGSVALCRLLVETTCEPGDSVLFAWRSFEAYPLLTRLAGAEPVTVPLDAAGRHDLPAMAAAVTDRTRLVFVCSPNNPTGTAVSPAELTDFLDAVPRDLLVVLDEAYVELLPAGSPTGLDLLAAYPNLLVLRTFSKAYGLAGARVGYGVGHPALAALLRSAQVPFAVAQPSIDLAVAALADDLTPRVAAITARREAFVGWLAARGVTVPASAANLVWLALGARTRAVSDALADRGVLVRPFDGEGIRVTIGDEREMAMLTAALDDVLVADVPESVEVA